MALANTRFLAVIDQSNALDPRPAPKSLARNASWAIPQASLEESGSRELRHVKFMDISRTRCLWLRRFPRISWHRFGAAIQAERARTFHLECPLCRWRTGIGLSTANEGILARNLV